MAFSAFLRPLAALASLAPTSVTELPLASQQRARRNALVASTALAQLRYERDEVDAWLATHERRISARTANVHRLPATTEPPARAAL